MTSPGYDACNVSCGHPLCELIGGNCSLATGRSRGCRPGLTSRVVAPGVFDEVRELLAAIEASADRAAAIRLAEIIRREAREDRLLMVIARDEEPELAPALEALCVRRR
jgi:hypothetical protein